MLAMQTFEDVIAKWPSKAVLAEAIGVAPGVVRAWSKRGIIPGRRLADIAAAAARAGFDGVTYAALCDIHRRSRTPS